MDELTLKGERYISSKRAAEMTGYTKDYVGQLCRAEKIDARLVGRNWYVNERSIFAHKKRGNVETSGNPASSGDRYSLLDEPVRYVTGSEIESPYYKKDPRPLIPTPMKPGRGREQESESASEQKADSPQKEHLEIPVKVAPKPEPTTVRHVPAFALQRSRQVSTPASTERVQEKRQSFLHALAIIVIVIGTISIFATLLVFEGAGQYERDVSGAAIYSSSVRMGDL